MTKRIRNYHGLGLLLLAITSTTIGCGGSPHSSATDDVNGHSKADTEAPSNSMPTALSIPQERVNLDPVNPMPVNPEPLVRETSPQEPDAKEPVAKEPVAQKRVTQYSDEAFRVAAHNGNIDIIRKAIESGINVDAPDPDRQYTALLMAAYNGHSHVVKVLLEHGANVDARDHEGKTPLIHASSGPFSETVTMLIDAGANVNATETTEGFTALMTAAALGEADVVKILLERGADPTVVDEDNDTAKDHARNAGKTTIVEMLP